MRHRWSHRVDERQWIQKYVEARKQWLGTRKPPLPTTAYRITAFNQMIADSAWDLPLNLTVRGNVISPESLADSTPVVRASAVHPADPPAGRVLHLHLRTSAGKTCGACRLP